MLVSQTGMAQLRFDFFYNGQRQEIQANWNFLFILGFQKKSPKQREDLKKYFFKKLVVIKNIFFKKTLELLGLLLYPWKFHIFSCFFLDILHVHTISGFFIANFVNLSYLLLSVSIFIIEQVMSL